jgi:hypothetical protein
MAGCMHAESMADSPRSLAGVAILLTISTTRRRQSCMQVLEEDEVGLWKGMGDNDQLETVVAHAAPPFYHHDSVNIWGYDAMRGCMTNCDFRRNKYILRGD